MREASTNVIEEWFTVKFITVNVLNKFHWNWTQNLLIEETIVNFGL